MMYKYFIKMTSEIPEDDDRMQLMTSRRRLKHIIFFNLNSS